MNRFIMNMKKKKNSNKTKNSNFKKADNPGHGSVTRDRIIFCINPIFEWNKRNLKEKKIFVDWYPIFAWIKLAAVFLSLLLACGNIHILCILLLCLNSEHIKKIFWALRSGKYLLSSALSVCWLLYSFNEYKF